MSMRTRILLIIFTVLLAVILLAVRPKAKNDELVFWTLQMRDFSPYIEKVIANFEQENPDIKINWVDIPLRG